MKAKCGQTIYINSLMGLAHHRVLCGSVIGARNPKVWGSIPHGDTIFFFVSRSWQDKKIKFYLAPTCWFWSRVRSLFNKVALAKSSFMIKVGGTPPFLALQHKFFSKAFKTPSSLFIPDRIGWKASREWGGGRG